MTQAELDALPEDGTFGLEEVVIDGKLIRRPVFHSVGVLYVEKDTDPITVTDIHGDDWFVGQGPDGKTYKRRARW